MEPKEALPPPQEILTMEAVVARARCGKERLIRAELTTYHPKHRTLAGVEASPRDRHNGGRTTVWP